MKKLFLFLIVGIIFASCSKGGGGIDPDPTLSSENLLKTFKFNPASNGNLSKTATAQIGILGADNVVLITVDENADLKSLKPSFTLSDNATLLYKDSPVSDGSTIIDFTDRVELTVVAEDGSKRYYQVLCKNGKDNVDNEIYKFMLKYSIPGISVAVNKDEELVYAHGYGYADAGNRVRTTSNHLFRLASVSKQQTALCIMNLIEEGKLDLNATVFGEGGILEDEFGTAMAASAKEVTIKNLLEHNSGWISSPDPMFTGDSRYYGKSLEKIIEYVLANVKQTYSPGATYSYYNLGYGILGKVIEKISGQDFETYLKENIHAKAGVTDIHVGGDRSEKRSNECVYYSQEGTNGYGNDMEKIKAAGGIIASAPELMKLMSTIDYGTKVPDILKKETLDLMYTPSRNYQRYGLGWRLNHAGFTNWAAYHSGNLAGTAAIWVRGKNGVCAVILCNSRSYLSDSGGSFDDYFYTLLNSVQSKF